MFLHNPETLRQNGSGQKYRTHDRIDTYDDGRRSYDDRSDIEHNGVVSRTSYERSGIKMSSFLVETGGGDITVDMSINIHRTLPVSDRPLRRRHRRSLDSRLVERLVVRPAAGTAESTASRERVAAAAAAVAEVRGVEQGSVETVFAVGCMDSNQAACSRPAHRTCLSHTHPVALPAASPGHKQARVVYDTDDRLLLTRTATRSCRTRKCVVHVYSPGVAARRRVWPAPLLLPLQQRCCCCS